MCDTTKGYCPVIVALNENITNFNFILIGWGVTSAEWYKAIIIPKSSFSIHFMDSLQRTNTNNYITNSTPTCSCAIFGHFPDNAHVQIDEIYLSGGWPDARLISVVGIR